MVQRNTKMTTLKNKYTYMIQYINMSQQELYDLVNKGTVLRVENLNLLNTIFEELPVIYNII